MISARPPRYDAANPNKTIKEIIDYLNQLQRQLEQELYELEVRK